MEPRDAELNQARSGIYGIPGVKPTHSERFIAIVGPIVHQLCVVSFLT
jgi:hypothetical protein